MRAVLLTLILTSAAVLAACTETSNKSTSGTGGAPPDAGKPSAAIQFSGVALADALSPTEVFVSWSDAVLLPNSVGAGAMIYRIYRSDTEEGAKTATVPVHVTTAGVTAWVDTGLQPFTTYFYRVVAVDPDLRTSISDRVTNARTVSLYSGGTFDYDTQLLPLFSSPSPTNPAVNCLSCHTTPGPGHLDLSTREGAFAGIGTAQDPDSFLVSFDGDATWAEFLGRMSGGFVMTNHLPWFSQPSAGLAQMEAPLREWVDQGGSLEPDSYPPVFALGGVGSAGSYFGEFIDFDTIRITFPHADDPETLPPNGNRAGQIEYAIYGGLRTNTINWDTPIALATVSQATQADPEVTAEFDWPFGGLAIIVVRPIDSAGRSVNYDPLSYDPLTATAQEKVLMQQRMRNQNSNEAEIVVVR